jgi:hypothetical protein
VKALLLLAFACTVFAQEAENPGKTEEKRSCTPCHSLRLIQSQRLKLAAWGKEIDKMMGWGAIVPNRELLLTYLSTEYSDTKPPTAVATSADGTKTAN